MRLGQGWNIWPRPLLGGDVVTGQSWTHIKEFAFGMKKMHNGENVTDVTIEKDEILTNRGQYFITI